MTHRKAIQESLDQEKEKLPSAQWHLKLGKRKITDQNDHLPLFSFQAVPCQHPTLGSSLDSVPLVPSFRMFRSTRTPTGAGRTGHLSAKRVLRRSRMLRSSRGAPRTRNWTVLAVVGRYGGKRRRLSWSLPPKMGEAVPCGSSFPKQPAQRLRQKLWKCAVTSFFKTSCAEV